MLKFLETFIPESVGMDFTEVNFLQSNEQQAEIDMLKVRQIFEKIVQTVHQHKGKEDSPKLLHTATEKIMKKKKIGAQATVIGNQTKTIMRSSQVSANNPP